MHDPPQLVVQLASESFVEQVQTLLSDSFEFQRKSCRGKG